jgi:hypothetical protein
VARREAGRNRGWWVGTTLESCRNWKAVPLMTDGQAPKRDADDGMDVPVVRVLISSVKRGAESIASNYLHYSIVALDPDEPVTIEAPYEDIGDGFERSIVVELRLHD